MKREELEADLISYLNLMGVEIAPERANTLVRHVELVLSANQRVNLTRVVEPAAALRLHTADSLSILEDVDAAPPGPLLDLGSGAGFPGIPLAVCTDRHTTLLDSVGKKVRELGSIILDLGLADQVDAVASRAEALARSAPGHFVVVTVRAVSELPALVELASPLLMKGGRLICMKGSPGTDEIARAEKVAKLVGMRPQYARSFELPEGQGHRTVVCYRKTAASGPTLPRREGLAQHAPLA